MDYAYGATGQNAHVGSALDLGDVSDADSDELELRLENARFEREVHDFLRSHRDPEHDLERPRPRRGRYTGKGSSRTSRKETEPRADIKLRLSQVNSAFLRGDYVEAERMIHEIIRINAETYQAWITLATICEDQGRRTDALTAKLYASYLRPKDDAAWLSCANLALSIAGDDDDSAVLKTAGTCFAQAILAQTNNLEARLGRAEVNHRRGHLVKAIREYAIVLEARPRDINIIRKMADACEASRNLDHVRKAVAAYDGYFAYLIETANDIDGLLFWGDISIYVELLACVGEYSGAITHLSYLSRWLLFRQDESYWDSWKEDDREWDREDSRRLMVPQFNATAHSPQQYGLGLPLELRAHLGLFRLKLGCIDESEIHLSWLEPTESATAGAVDEFPGIIRDIADALYECGKSARALDYYELLRGSVFSNDPELLFNLGMCYVNNSNTGAAEDCFLLTIEADEDHVEARIELARIYEHAHEDEEALILVTEAIALQGLQGGHRNYSEPPGEQGVAGSDGCLAAQSSTRKTRSGRKPGAGVVRRYRPKRLVGADQRKREERERADELSRRHKEVRDLKRQIKGGARHLVPAWMAAARDLVDDFRSFRKFFTWEKYVKQLGAANELVFNAPYQLQPGTSELHKLAERLSRNVMPTQTDDRRLSEDDGYRGIPFGEWLELFLDYAISLALSGCGDEAYQVCEAARDSIVFTNSKDYMFLIHVAWAACAIYMADEEMCVVMGRFFTKVNQLDSDAYRMFAALCRLCQSPASWYNSGPVQKYILRQIRLIDTTQLQATQPGISGQGPVDLSEAQGETRNLDVCLLMLYGHILFTSTSYTFALNYFLRARALAPMNPMVNLSVGLGYVHHGLKRQSENRQYLIMQGLSGLYQYSQARLSSAVEGERREAYFTIARVFHMLGLHHIAHAGYHRVFNHCAPPHVDMPGDQDIFLCAAFNEYVLLMTSGDVVDLEDGVLPLLIL